MFKQKPFIFSLIVLFTLITLHSVGSYYSWYWVYPQFDVLVHLVSGLWIGLIILWLASCFGQVNSLKEYKVKSFLIAFISALFIGIIWEVLENITQITFVDAHGYALNTTKDIIADGLGGILAYMYFTKRKKSVSDAVNVLHPFYNQTGIIKN